MGMENVVAREQQIERLEDVYASNRAELVAVYGRRRIGKTFLIDKFFSSKGPYFKLTGSKGSSLKAQLKNFAANFSDTFMGAEPIATPESWADAFMLLQRTIKKMDNQKRIVLFFDEFPWLASPRSNFLRAFDYFWNQYMSCDPRIIVVICGSAAAWMIRHVIGDRGGLHGRVTRKIRLLPFTLSETQRYLTFQGVHLDKKQVTEIYMAIGGVAQYLSLIKPGQSSAQAIQDLCFTSDGYLTNEFFHIYASLFDNYEEHIAVVRALSQSAKPLSREDLIKKLGIQSSGRITRVLRELEESGFILGVHALEARKKSQAYHLIDPFTLFHLRWIDKVLSNVTSGSENHWIKEQLGKAWASWAGYAFETVCIAHIKQLKNGLGLSAIGTRHSQWLCKKSAKDSSQKGAQIDLLIDRADGCINLCEIKFCSSEFIVTKEYAQTLYQRRVIFAEKTKTKKALFNTLITPYGAVKNMHYLGSIDVQLTLEDLFKDPI